MREMLEWKNFQSFFEMEEKEKRKAIRDNFEFLLEMLEEKHPEFRKVNRFIEKKSGKMGLSLIPFIADHQGRVTIRTSYICGAYQKHFDALSFEEEMECKINQARQMENWFLEIYGWVPHIELFYDGKSEEIFVNLAESIGSIAEFTKGELQNILKKIKEKNIDPENQEKICALEMEMIFQPEEAAKKVEMLIHKLILEQEKALIGICNFVEAGLKQAKSELRDILKEIGFESRLNEWFQQNPEFVFSYQGELVYLEE